MPEQTDPFAKFHEWMAGRSSKSEPNDANAMTVATATAEGRAVGAHRAAQGDRGFRAAGLRLLHQPRKPQGR